MLNFKFKYLGFLVVLFPILPWWALKLMLIIIFIFSLFRLKLIEKPKKPFLQGFYLALGLFATMFISALMNYKAAEAWFYVERGSSWILVGLVFLIAFKKYDFKAIQTGILGFVGANLALNAIAFYKVFQALYPTIGAGKQFESWKALANDDLFSYQLRTIHENISGYHPTYAALLLGVAILLLLFLILKLDVKFSFKHIFYLLILLILWVFQLLLASRTPMVATVLSGWVLLFMHFKLTKQRLTIVALTLIAGVMMWHLVPSLANRLKEVSLTNLVKPNQKQADSFNLRTGIYSCTLQLVSENWVTGLGVGNVQNALNECYYRYSPVYAEKETFNTHNQYLDYWLNMGLIGIVLFLTFLWNLAKQFLKMNEPIYLCILILFCICFLTENILLREAGLMPFMLFWSFALKQEKMDAPELPIKPL